MIVEWRFSSGVASNAAIIGLIPSGTNPGINPRRKHSNRCGNVPALQNPRPNR